MCSAECKKAPVGKGNKLQRTLSPSLGDQAGQRPHKSEIFPQPARHRSCASRPRTPGLHPPSPGLPPPASSQRSICASVCLLRAMLLPLSRYKIILSCVRIRESRSTIIALSHGFILTEHAQAATHISIGMTHIFLLRHIFTSHFNLRRLRPGWERFHRFERCCWRNSQSKSRCPISAIRGMLPSARNSQIGTAGLPT